MATTCRLQPLRVSMGAALLLTIILTGSLAGIARADSAAAEVEGLSALDGLGADELERLRGREGIDLVNVQSIQDITSSVSDSVINAGSVVSGPITIEARALDSFSGVGLFNIMTGNNNAVGTAVGISIYLSK